MALENLVGADKFIGALVPSNPTGGDDKREGDDHIRGIKNALKNSFPNINGAVTATEAELSSVAGKVNRTGDVMSGSLGVNGNAPNLFAIEANQGTATQGAILAIADGYVLRMLNPAQTIGGTMQLDATFGGLLIGADGGNIGFIAGGARRAYIGSDGTFYLGLSAGMAPAMTISGAGRPSLRFQGETGNPVVWTTSLKGDNPAESHYMISNPPETVGVYMTKSASGWVNMSDARHKADILPITGALAKVQALQGVTYKIAADMALPRDVGLIAQDVLAVLPEAVDTSDPERYGLRYHCVIPLLLEAIKELTARVEALEAV